LQTKGVAKKGENKMKVNCSKSSLVNSLKTNAENILLTAEDNVLSITGNTYEMGVVQKIDANTEINGTAVVNARIFNDIVRKLPSDQVMIEAESETVLLIKSGTAIFKIMQLNTPYPPVSFIDESNQLTIETSKLHEAIKQTIFATTQEIASKPIFRGVYINGDVLVALDGTKMAQKRLQLNIEGSELIVPSKVLNEVLKLNSKEIAICYSDKQIMFRTDDTAIVASLINGPYVPHERLLNKDAVNLEIVASTEAIIGSLERCLVVSNDDKRPVVIKISDNVLNISINAMIGKFNEDIEVEQSGNDLTIGFNAKHMLACLKAVNTEKVKLAFGNQTQPCFVLGEDYTFLVMPVRLQQNE
jgi:DNA polymerase-3 subunit beta